MSNGTDHDEPSEESLRDMPELDFDKLKPLGRGRHAHLATGKMVHHVTIDPDLWPYFGSAEKVNEALRALVTAAKIVKRDPEPGEPVAAQ
jgi:hypothetical protein